MSIRLSYRMGPVRVSVPLTSGSTRRRRGKTWHAIATFADGSEYKCHHDHRTEQAAVACAQKYRRDREAGKAVPPLTKKPRARRASPPPRSAAQKPGAHMQESLALLRGLQTVNSPESARTFVTWATWQIRELAAGDPRYAAGFYNAFTVAALTQGRAEIDDARHTVDRATSQAQVTAAREHLGLVDLRTRTVRDLGINLGIRPR
jgi:hypothetical protein